MSDSSRTDDSVPSLSSYPPTFVSLITTFIKRYASFVDSVEFIQSYNDTIEFRLYTSVPMLS